MKIRMLGVLLLLIAPIVAMSSLAPVRAQTNHAQHTLTVPVKGTFTSSASGLTGPGTFSGTFTLRRFVGRAHHLYAIGTLAGTLKDANGTTKDVSRTTTLAISKVTQGSTTSSMSLRSAPASSSGSPALQGSCNVLTLNIGAIHLNLLGLVVDLSPINLNITGQTGSGNLLGNLVCGIAGLLDNLNLSSLTQQLLGDITMLLNQVLAGL